MAQCMICGAPHEPDGRHGPRPGDTATCRHCGKRIVLVNFLTGPDWMHQPVGDSFQNRQHRYCHRTVAEPNLRDRRPHSRACGIAAHEHGSACHANCPTCGGRDG